MNSIKQIITSKLRRIDDVKHRNKILFFAGLFIKLVLGIFFASTFLVDLFIPFVNYFVESGFQNPYQYFVLQNQLNAFPYPALMLYVLAIPKIILGFLPGNMYFDLFVYRLPILLADLVILFVIYKWIKTPVKKILIYYWLSPVLIYICYLHGQLDAIPIAFLFISLFFLFKENNIKSSVLLGLALATKTNILMVIPFFVFFLIKKRNSLVNILCCLMLVAGSFIIVNLPYLFNPAFIKMVFLNSIQMKIFDIYFAYPQSVLFYLVPSIYLILLAKSFSIKSYNKDIFIMFLGFSFGLILLLIPPMQGWYFWIIPFFAYFYIKNRKRSSSVWLFVGLQASYLIYFFVAKNSDFFSIFSLISSQIASAKNFFESLVYLGINADQTQNIAFTVLQTMLLLNCVWIYQKGISSYSKHKITSKPYLIGIVGVSGSGKTTLADSLQNVFMPKNTTIVRGDDMHKWKRGDENWDKYTHLDPKANELHKEINYLAALKKGHKISRRHYDHGTGLFTEEQSVSANKVIIFEGLHAFFNKKIRELYDLKIFIKPEQQLSCHWKIMRDMQKRSHTKETVLNQIKKRESDVKKFISSQEKYADILIEILCDKPIKDLGNPAEKTNTYIKIKLPSSIFIDTLVAGINTAPSISTKHYYENTDTQAIEIRGAISKQKTDLLAHQYIPGLDEINISNSLWDKNQTGIIQLIVSYYIMEFTNIDNENQA
jgi:uridine kinase/Gpi18-like mannosyltransferase